MSDVEDWEAELSEGEQGTDDEAEKKVDDDVEDDDEDEDEDEYVLASEDSITHRLEDAIGKDGHDDRASSSVKKLRKIKKMEVEDINDPLQKLIELLDETYIRDPMAAVPIVKENKLFLENSEEGLWRIARSWYDYATSSKGKELELLKEGQLFARRAINSNENSASAHKWYGIITGSMTDYVGLNEKLKCGEEFKEHVEIAIRLDPDDSLLSHLLGRWCFEVAGLSWIEKRACAALFGTPPEATYDDALRHLLKAEKLSPQWGLNMLFLGKAYAKLGNSSESRKWLEATIAIKEETKEDREAVEGARKLL
eukprot:m.4098 g.4098  ORF g.4098 m.4098 type:complete len:311 (-) comp2168_c1_seq1:1051-1983(-)